KTLPSSNGLSDYFMKSKGMPNIAIIVIDGLSSDYLADGKFSGFMPFLDSLTTQSLYWSRFLSNSTSKTDAITNILGSLPHGKNGFTKLENTVNRNTLFGIAKEKGYQTSFYYGGNTALDGLNRFLKEEQVDIVVDKSRFNDTYKLQDTDRAGVTLGYSDFELYKKWGASYLPLDQPKLECFLNLSTSKPFSFPELSEYSAKAQNIKENLHFKPQEERFIKKNIELFAALNYTDTALRSLFEMYQTTKGYGNTIFLITGSSRPYLHKDHIVQERHVPFLLLSPLMKQPKVFENLVSHHDIAPSILQLLSKNMTSKYPKKVAWIGDGLLSQNTNILLPKSGGGLSALVKHNHVIVGRTVSKIDGNLTLHVPEKSFNALLKSNLKHFKALNKYVTTNDKILPITDIIFQSGGKVISKEELVWISSVFNGKNYDNAYKIARELAHDGNYEKALVLAEYILEKTPGHIDAMILQGRIYAWKKHFSKAIAILEAAVDEHPFYHDAYAALLDVYYWSGNNARALHIYQKIKENHIETVELVEKVERCMNQIKGAEETTNGGRLLALEEKDIK
ncbi:MAG: sulfatase-like hydrolase/transferase, partial [Croceivirga sp.]